MVKSIFLLHLIALYSISISGIGVDLYAPSLPAIAQTFQVPDVLAKLTITGYMLGYGLGQLPFGILSHSWGRKKLLVFGLLLFTIASFIAPFTHNIYLLILLRFIQGLGATSASVISKTLYTDSLTGNQLHLAMVYFAITWAIGPMIAPVIGGYIQYYQSY